MAAVEVSRRARPQTGQRSPWRERLDGLASPSGMLLIAALVVAAFAVTTTERDPDFWWHLRTGQLLLANHLQLLGTDPYTYSVPGHAWTMHEWLFEVCIAELYSVGGIGAIVLVLSALTWLGILAMVGRTRLLTRSRVAIGLGILVAVIAADPIWGPRDQMIDFTFACVVLLLVERYLTGGGRWLWILPPLFLLWSNLHGGFVIGLVFIAAIAAAEALGARLGLPEPAPLRRSGWLALTTLGCGLMSMVNPNGPGILIYAWATVASPAQQALILEWQSPNFQMEEVRAFAVMLVSLAGFIVVNRRLRARDLVLVAGTAALALESVRNIALFVAAATPVWSEQLAILTSRLREQRDGRRHRALAAATGEPADDPEATSRAAPPPAPPPPLRRGAPPFSFRVAVLGIVTVALLGGYIGLRLAPSLAAAPGDLSYARTYPVCASQWLRSGPHGLRIFNQYGEGGYLAWSLAGTGDRIFVFGDAALMGDSLLYTYAQVIGAEPGWQGELERYGTQVVLFDTGTPFDQVLRSSPRWVRVYHDPLSDAFVLRDQEAALRLPPQPRPTGTCSLLAAQGLGTASS
ncbi:MAG TPA: hypothetical protein VEK76_09890 [Candidatus Binatia bacterium]|nr:hypothetical protein [Candidatus Binatia bacterium]